MNRTPERPRELPTPPSDGGSPDGGFPDGAPGSGAGGARPGAEGSAGNALGGEDVTAAGFASDERGPWARVAESVRSRRPLPEGGIILAATPLGDPGDASLRLADALATADIVAAEDTRRVRALAEAIGVHISGQVVSNFDHNEDSRAASLVAAAASGRRVLVVSDAGMPSVSDPGFAAVRAARDAGVPVTCVPGPSAVPTALALSGIGMGRFAFEGFAPRKDGARRSWLSGLGEATHTTCFFESPHRLASTLQIAVEVLGAERQAAVCRELTKTYEEVRTGTLGELAAWADGGVRGEITVVIAPADAAAAARPEDLVEAVELRVAAGERLKSAAGIVAAAAGVGKRELYEAVVAARAAAVNSANSGDDDRP